MKKKRTIFIVFALLVIVMVIYFIALQLRHSERQEGKHLYQVPRVLIITSGKDGNGTLPEGGVIAMEYFTKAGAFVKIDNRDALLNETLLSRYDVLVLLSAIGYHDADRMYSLTYMDDAELEILSHWVYNGGVLISGDNIGRNLRDGTDRISMYGRLEPVNWGLSECFGVMLSERNIEGLQLSGTLNEFLAGELISQFENETWLLVPDSLLHPDVKVLAVWENDSLSYPALIMNQYGKGVSFLLPTSYLLHPSNNGGYWNTVQIRLFYKFVMKKFYERFPIRVDLQVWPAGHTSAFAVTLNSDGDQEHYKRMFDFLSSQNIDPTLFVGSNFNEELKNFVLNADLNIQSNSMARLNMRNLSFSETVFHTEMNERFWKRSFSGFRFPFTMNSFWGMTYLNRKGYLYDSSIGTDHSTTFYGSLFPYNLPVFQEENYQTLELLEVSPLARDDYFYFRMLIEDQQFSDAELMEKAELFHVYLQDFWKNFALESGGMMIYLGHPLFTAYNDTTLFPLSSLIDTVRKDGAWMTTLEDIATRWLLLEKLKLDVCQQKDHYQICVSMPVNNQLDGLTIRIYEKPRKVSAHFGKSKVIRQEDSWLIIFDAVDGQVVELWF